MPNNQRAEVLGRKDFRRQHAIASSKPGSLHPPSRVSPSSVTLGGLALLFLAFSASLGHHVTAIHYPVPRQVSTCNGSSRQRYGQVSCAASTSQFLMQLASTQRHCWFALAGHQQKLSSPGVPCRSRSVRTQLPARTVPDIVL